MIRILVLEFILRVELVYTVTRCCNVRLLVRACFCILQKNTISSRSGRLITKEKEKNKNKHHASPSSSVDPRIFAFYRRESPRERFHDCFPCNKKFSFITERNTICAYLLFKDRNLRLYIESGELQSCVCKGKYCVTLEDQEV